MPSDKDWMNLVIFKLYRTVFAVPAEPIQQIIEMTTITPILPVQEGMEGMMNYHETLVPVINLCTYLAAPRVGFRQHAPILLAEIENRLVGLMVDEVQEVISVPPTWVITTQEIYPKRIKTPTLMRGLVKVQEKMAMLVDINCLPLQ